MNKVCFVIDSGHEDKSVPKLVNAIRHRGLECVQSEMPRQGYLNVGWGKAAGSGGLNRERPHNKEWEIQKLHEWHVPTVPYSISFEDAVRMAWVLRRERGLSAVILGRRKQRRQGSDILRFPITEPTLQQQLAVSCPGERDFWTLEIAKDAEYRVHVFGQKVEMAATKVPKNKEGELPVVWNQETCDFDYSQYLPEGAADVARAATAAYGLDFAAVDVLRSVENEYYVLEVNLRPGLNEEMVSYYAAKIAEAASSRQ